MSGLQLLPICKEYKRSVCQCQPDFAICKACVSSGASHTFEATVGTCEDCASRSGSRVTTNFHLFSPLPGTPNIQQASPEYASSRSHTTKVRVEHDALVTCATVTWPLTSVTGQSWEGTLNKSAQDKLLDQMEVQADKGLPSWGSWQEVLDDASAELFCFYADLCSCSGECC